VIEAACRSHARRKFHDVLLSVTISLIVSARRSSMLAPSMPSRQDIHLQAPEVRPTRPLCLLSATRGEPASIELLGSASSGLEDCSLLSQIGRHSICGALGASVRRGSRPHMQALRRPPVE
jgi:hypothetical protein